MSTRHTRRFAAATVGLAAAAVVTGCAAEPSPEIAVRTFLLDWQAGDYRAAARQTDGDVEQVAAALEQAHDQLDLAALRLSLGPITKDGETATAEFEAEADLGIGDPVWNYDGSMPLTRTGGGWTISWSPSVIHPELGEGERLAVTYDVPDRGQIYDREEEPLVGETEVVAFGVRPADMADMEDGVGRLAELLDEDPAPLLNRVRSAPPEAFQPLVLMREKDVASALLDDAEAVPGVEAEQIEMPLSPKSASAVIGEVAGTVEHKVSSRVSGPYQAGDTVGLGGLQSVYQQRLAGTATTEIVTLGEGGERTDILYQWPGAESGSLTTTLDGTVQEAAEGALSLVPENAHLVALDARNGEILASASRPGSVDNDGAFTKEYLPGEAFTIVSTAALLESGAAGPDRSVPCEAEQTVGDRTFTTINGTGLWGRPDLATDFAHTCTTAFASLADSVDPDALAATAADFGIGSEWRLPVPAYSGEFTVPGGTTETAAAMVGAGQVRVSPLTMALAAGAVADGSWHAPRLVTDDGGGRQEEQQERRLNPEAIEPLREMMRSTVVEGSASAANVGTVPVHGQTGVAEQRIDGEDTAVQWFVGYQGHIAFAVAVETDPSHTYRYSIGAAADFLQRLPFDYVQRIGAETGDEQADVGGVPATTPGT
ncbi:cell division protein FtsI/penicillin-binding protein 2 [Spinactinospora alkalitolerans]|uniref:Cell division protein FtsI/penicillin-binding protein 2 n=1 Tax=Spinactinospora alkalitolerans TaxID=687207 RepID=A0A852U253_9ACTN|nr:penicillin-binding transpeptidase domain-containing protein [Spinactinospora alkalitolerans]NYE49615.1 cell division protein FtsI/penicillin-binding protein 2 [Spinactinospora alkalitolerans]